MLADHIGCCFDFYTVLCICNTDGGLRLFLHAFCVIYPILRVLKKLSALTEPAQFHQLSQIIKSIMMMGILSMIFLKYYTSWIG